MIAGSDPLDEITGFGKSLDVTLRCWDQIVGGLKGEETTHRVQKEKR